jgi:hypothetical protein
MSISTRQLAALVIYCLIIAIAATWFKHSVIDAPTLTPTKVKHRISEKFDRFHKTPNERVADGFAAFDRKPVIANGE